MTTPAGTIGLSANSNYWIFGGTTGTALNTIQKYTGSVRTTEVSTLASAAAGLSTTRLGGAIFIFSGTTIQRWNGIARTTDGATLAFTAPAQSSASISSLNAIFVLASTIQKYDGTTRTSMASTYSQASQSVSDGNSSITAMGTTSLAVGGSLTNYDGTTVSSITAGSYPTRTNNCGANNTSFGGQINSKLGVVFSGEIVGFTPTAATLLAEGGYGLSHASAASISSTSKVFGGYYSSTAIGQGAYGYSGSVLTAAIRNWDGGTISTDSATLAVAMNQSAAASL
jgi:hypothetical protein